MPAADAIAAAAGGNLSPAAPGLSGAAAGGNLSPAAPGPAAGSADAIATITGTASPALSASLLRVPYPTGANAVLGQPMWTTYGTVNDAEKLHALHLITPAAATVEQICPKADQTSGSGASNSTSLLVYNGLGYDTYWLWYNSGNPIWRTNASTADAGATVIAAGTGITIQRSTVVPFASGLGAQWAADPSVSYFWKLSNAFGYYTGTGHRPGGITFTATYGAVTGSPSVALYGSGTASATAAAAGGNLSPSAPGAIAG